MTKAKLLDFVKSLMDTNTRIANDPRYSAEHAALACERFAVLLSLLPAVEALEEPVKPANTGEGVAK